MRGRWPFPERKRSREGEMKLPSGKKEEVSEKVKRGQRTNSHKERAITEVEIRLDVQTN